MPKQKELPGVERESIPAIEAVADAYVKVCDRRMKLTEQEITAKAVLLEVVTKHADVLAVNGDGQRIYRFEDEVVILEPGKANVKVKRAHAEPDEAEE